MRSALVICFAVLLVFVPAVQASACTCASAAPSDGAQHEVSCCCGDAASCQCQGCDGHEPNGEESGPSLTGCICTTTQPQVTPTPTVDFVALPIDLGRVWQAVPNRETCSPRTATTSEGDLRPTSSLPLLV